MKSFHKVALVVLMALALAGCTTKNKALAQSRGSFIAGQQQGFAQAQAQVEAAGTAVTVLGDVRNRTVEWVEELTLSQAIVAAEYLRALDPTAITITRQGRKYEVSPKRLTKGLEDPYLEPGDVVELHR